MSTAAFDAVKQVIRVASAEELPAILGQLEEVKAAAWARLVNPRAPKAEPKDEEGFPKPQEAAAIAQVPPKRIYDWARGQRWARRPTRRCLRISEQGFRKWLQSR